MYNHADVQAISWAAAACWCQTMDGQATVCTALLLLKQTDACEATDCFLGATPCGMPQHTLVGA